MDPVSAMNQTHAAVASMTEQLTSEHREMQTPCKKWVAHDLINHMVGGAYMFGSVLAGEAPSGDPEADLMPEGPAKGWADASASLAASATPENLEAMRQAPFGEMPGAVLLSVMTADHLVHAWDLSRATGIDHGISDELAEFALATWQVALPDEARDGDAFDVVQPCADDAPAMDKVAAFTGRAVE